MGLGWVDVWALWARRSIIVTPTESSLGTLDPAKLTWLDRDGHRISGEIPTKELPLHSAIYRTRKSWQAIVHLHPTHSVAVSMLPEIDQHDVFPPMTAYYLMKVGRTALLPYFRPGDPRVVAAINALDGQYSSVLLANHGPIVAGLSLAEAGATIEELEQTARLYLLVGNRNCRVLTDDETAALRK